MSLSHAKFKEGDRVTRSIELGGTIRRHGVITKVYGAVFSSTHGIMPLYAVRWDGQEREEVGYIGNDFELEGTRT